MRAVYCLYFLFLISLLSIHCGALKNDSPASAKEELTPVKNSVIFFTDESIKVSASQLSFPDGIQHIPVEQSNDKYKFLHDPAIIAHKGALIAGWYNCPEEEIADESCIRARRSLDGGTTWSGVEVIAEDKEKKGIYYVPVQLLSCKNELYAFVGKMTDHDRIINTTTYKYNEQNKIWNELGIAGELFLPNCTPVKIGNGRWIIAGRVASAPGQLPLIPAILISEGDDIEKPWRVVKLQQEEFKGEQHPETTIIPHGKVIYAFTRVDGPDNIPAIFISNDYGETWNSVKEHDFRALSSKLCAGTLSDGRGYIVFNYPVSNEVGLEARTVLALAISKDGNNPFSFSSIYKIQSAGQGSPMMSHYPCAVEHEGKLYIVYTANFAGEEKRQCELAIVPVKSLHY